MGRWGWGGVALFAVGLVALVLDIPGLNVCWFLFGWTGWLLGVDAVIAARQGHSLLAGRRRELAAMLVVSVAYWTLFEFANLRLANWYYVFLPRSPVWQALYATAAFSTVLPACFFHAELLGALGIWADEPDEHQERRAACPPPVVLEAALLAFGSMCIALPLLWPRQCFWMIWGAPLGIPLVLNARLGAPSLLDDLIRRRPNRLLRLLGGGVIAGGLWEGLNYWARAKWIYTVPGLESHKLFEMPWLGFVGFPVLAVASFEAYSLWCHVARGGRHWQRLDTDQPPVLSRHRAIAMLGVVVFSVLASTLPLDPAVQARRPVLRDLPELDGDARKMLVEEMVFTPESLVRMAPQLRRATARYNLPASTFDDAVQTAELMLHKGMGADGAAWLRSVGVRSMEDLAGADPDALTTQLVTTPSTGRPITAPQVRVWVRAAHGGRSRR